MRLTVQHCVLARVVRQYGRPRSSDLLGVNYFFTVPADTEFPHPVSPLELFVRFHAQDSRPARIRVAIARSLPDGTDGAEDHRQRFDLPFPTQPALVIMDFGLKLLNVSLPGAGDYVVRVLRPVRAKWQPTAEWRTLASEYFRLEKAP